MSSRRNAERQSVSPAKRTGGVRGHKTINVSLQATRSVLLLVSDRWSPLADEVAETLRSKGFDVVLTRKVSEAIEAVGQRSFDLLIGGTSLLADDVSTWNRMNALRARCGGRGILLSAAGLDPVSQRALELGYGLYVADTLDRKSLLRCVNDLLRDA